MLINLPPHPEAGMFYKVYRFTGTVWEPALNVALPDDTPGASGVALQSINDCDTYTCLYGADGDRDGSVELLLLLESVEREFLSERLKQVSALELQAGATATPVLSIALAELFAPGLLGRIQTPTVRVTQLTGDGNVTGGVAELDGLPAVELAGLKRTVTPEDVRIELLDDRGMSVSTLTLQVSVPNRPPVVTFLLDGVEITSTLMLSPGGTETVVVVRILDPDGNQGLRVELIEGDNLVVTPVSRVLRTVADGASVEVIEHRLVLNSAGSHPLFSVRLRVTDATDDRSVSESDALMVCFVNARGACPPRPSVAAGGGGGGGGGSGLLWLAATGGVFSLRIRRRWRAARPCALSALS